MNSDEQQWLERFYAARAAGLVLYGRALGLSRGEAEDVLHETFLALMKAPEFPLETENYFVRSFRNRALNFKRTLWRSLRTAAFFSYLLPDGHWFEKPAHEDEVALQSAAMNCLAELPQEQREVIVLKIWNRFTFEEIGGLLEISPNTAAGRYRYGLLKMKRKLEQHSTFTEFSAGQFVGFSRLNSRLNV